MIAVPVFLTAVASLWLYTSERQPTGSRLSSEGELTIQAYSKRDHDRLVSALRTLPGVRVEFEGSAVMDPWTRVAVRSTPPPEAVDIQGIWPDDVMHIAISEDVADSLGVEVGSAVESGHFTGMTVSGIVPYVVDTAWVSTEHPVWPDIATYLRAIGPHYSLERVGNQVERSRSQLPANPSGSYSPPFVPFGASVEFLMATAFGSIGLAITGAIVSSALLVGVRRRIRNIGLLSINGGAPSDLRAVVLTESTLLASIGAGVGVAGALVVSQAMPFGFSRLRLSALPILPVVLSALLAGWLASVPAVHAAVRTPVSAARAGRVPSLSRPERRFFFLPAAMLGFGLILFAVALVDGNSAATGALAATLIGAGGIGLAPILILAIARVGPLLPKMARISARLLDRQRMRTVAATTAIGAVMSLPVWASMSASQMGEGPVLPPTVATVRSIGHEETDRFITTALIDRFPAAHQISIGFVSGLTILPGTDLEVRVDFDDGAHTTSSAGLDIPRRDRGLVLDPRTAQDLGMPGLAQALREGDIAYMGTSVDGTAVWIGPSGVASRFRGLIEDGALGGVGLVMTADTARSLGLDTRMESTPYWALGRVPAKGDDAVLSMVGITSQQSDFLERGEYLGPGNLVWAAVIIAAFAVGIIGTITSALLRQDMDEGVSTVIAVGGSPSIRRSVLAWSQFFMVVVAGLIVVSTGVLMQAISTWASPDLKGLRLESGPVLVVLVGLPLMAAGISWLTTRNGRPMVTRRA